MSAVVGCGECHARYSRCHGGTIFLAQARNNVTKLLTPSTRTALGHVTHSDGESHYIATVAFVMSGLLHRQRYWRTHGKCIRYS